MDFDFSDVKVHNEIEFCAVWDLDIKAAIERALLSNRISYYEKWNDTSFFGKLFGEDTSKCTICVNRMQIEEASEVLANLGLNRNDYELVMRRVDKTFF